MDGFKKKIQVIDSRLNVMLDDAGIADRPYNHRADEIRFNLVRFIESSRQTIGSSVPPYDYGNETDGVGFFAHLIVLLSA